MPKLIDADKLMEWLENSSEGDGFWAGSMEQANSSFDALADAIDAGTFDPTPPVQPDTHGTTYKCPHCREAHEANAWNVATAATFGAQEITRIDEPDCVGSTFTCPSCGSEEDYGCLEVITDEQR